jgi:hypothetical protein
VYFKEIIFDEGSNHRNVTAGLLQEYLKYTISPYEINNLQYSKYYAQTHTFRPIQRTFNAARAHVLGTAVQYEIYSMQLGECSQAEDRSTY